MAKVGHLPESTSSIGTGKTISVLNIIPPNIKITVALLKLLSLKSDWLIGMSFWDRQECWTLLIFRNMFTGIYPRSTSLKINPSTRSIEQILNQKSGFCWCYMQFACFIITLREYLFIKHYSK